MSGWFIPRCGFVSGILVIAARRQLLLEFYFVKLHAWIHNVEIVGDSNYVKSDFTVETGSNSVSNRYGTALSRLNM
jgi:hypothetical protein